MKYLKRFFWLAFILLLGIFAFRNQTYLGQRVDLVFFKNPVPLVLGFWLVLCFLLGLIVYMVIDMPRDLVMKRDLRRKTQEIARLQAEVNRLANAANPVNPIKPINPINPAHVPQHPFPSNPDLEKRLGL
jgi:uncharacterized integral membrane protein